MNHSLALVVPSLHQSGGVPAVARFVKDAAERGGWFVRPISLCMSTTDGESTSVLNPATWLREPAAGYRRWVERDVPHVGARLSELEFQRYRPRAALAALVAPSASMVLKRAHEPSLKVSFLPKLSSA